MVVVEMPKHSQTNKRLSLTKSSAVDLDNLFGSFSWIIVTMMQLRQPKIVLEVTHVLL